LPSICSSAPTVIYTLSLHDALPIFLCVCLRKRLFRLFGRFRFAALPALLGSGGGDLEGEGVVLQPNMDLAAMDELAEQQFLGQRDRKSTRLNSSHVKISYAVFCLKK